MERGPLPTFNSFVDTVWTEGVADFLKHLPRIRRLGWFRNQRGEIRSHHPTGVGYHDPISAVAELLSPGLTFRHDQIRDAAAVIGMLWEDLCALQASIDNQTDSIFYDPELSLHIYTQL